MWKVDVFLDLCNLFSVLMWGSAHENYQMYILLYTYVLMCVRIMMLSDESKCDFC